MYVYIVTSEGLRGTLFCNICTVDSKLQIKTTIFQSRGITNFNLGQYFLSYKSEESIKSLFFCNLYIFSFILTKGYCQYQQTD